MRFNPVRTAPARRTPVRIALAAATAVLLAACGSSDTSGAAASDDSISVQDAWVRATAGSENPSMTAAFMVIYNDGDDAVELVGAASEVAGVTELHEMASVDGEMVMRQVEGGIEIAAGRGKELAPGGHHVMLMDVHDELAPGDEVEFTLSFSDGSTLEVTAPVKAFTEEEGTYHDHGSHDHGAEGDESDGDHEATS